MTQLLVWVGAGLLDQQERESAGQRVLPDQQPENAGCLLGPADTAGAISVLFYCGTRSNIEQDWAEGYVKIMH